jgi:formylmethanofuran dehydrogenase subunit E
MNYPAFYDLAPRISMCDPLAALLGASDDGMLEYSYLDAVRLAGHSCPTVAGAYLVARAAMTALFPDGPAIRGEIDVRMPAPESDGTTGVIAQVLTVITGAAAANGFQGIGGHFVRRSLLHFSDISDTSAIGFRRRDNAVAVSVELDLRPVPAPANLRQLLALAIDPVASAAQREAFAQAWQGRVRALLLDHADDPGVLRVTRIQ